jgi:hypothetical protein
VTAGWVVEIVREPAEVLVVDEIVVEIGGLVASVIGSVVAGVIEIVVGSVVGVLHDQFEYYNWFADTHCFETVPGVTVLHCWILQGATVHEAFVVFLLSGACYCLWKVPEACPFL